jgi:hypothetical protein
MSAAMIRRIERLERRKPSGKPWTDPHPLMLALLAALDATSAADKARRPYSLLPSPPLSDAAEPHFALLMRDSDRMAERLRVGLPAPS